MHLRLPSIAHGVQAFIWAVVFFLFLWFGMLAVGVSDATAFILALVLGAVIFLFIRIFGEDELGSSRGAAPRRSFRPTMRPGRGGACRERPLGRARASPPGQVRPCHSDARTAGGAATAAAPAPVRGVARAEAQRPAPACGSRPSYSSPLARISAERGSKPHPSN